MRSQITGNQAHDRRVNRALRERGWALVRVWEHELKRRNEPQLVRRLLRILGRNA
jgi:DNA mismatch endonuclease (patch repair protein)